MIAATLLASRVLLALVFAVSGVAKLFDQPGTRRALLDFGAPAVVVIPFALVLPLLELAVAIALVPTDSAWIGACAALGLLVVFMVVIGASLVRGRRPPCHCFGRFDASPVGWPTLVRAGIFAAVAGLLVWAGPSASDAVQDWPAEISAVQALGLLGVLILVGVLAAEGWLLGHLLVQNGRLLLRIEVLEDQLASAGAPMLDGSARLRQSATSLPIGALAPGFQLRSFEGPEVSLDDLLWGGRPALLLFAEPGCGPCMTLMAEVGQWQQRHADVLTIAVVSQGRPSMNSAARDAFGVTGVLLQRDREVAEAYGASGAPSAVLISPEGRISSALLQGADRIRAFVSQMVTTATTAVHVGVGGD